MTIQINATEFTTMQGAIAAAKKDGTKTAILISGALVIDREQALQLEKMGIQFAYLNTVKTTNGSRIVTVPVNE